MLNYLENCTQTQFPPLPSYYYTSIFPLIFKMMAWLKFVPASTTIIIFVRSSIVLDRLASVKLLCSKSASRRQEWLRFDFVKLHSLAWVLKKSLFWIFARSKHDLWRLLSRNVAYFRLASVNKQLLKFELQNFTSIAYELEKSQPRMLM